MWKGGEVLKGRPKIPRITLIFVVLPCATEGKLAYMRRQMQGRSDDRISLDEDGAVGEDAITSERVYPCRECCQLADLQG